MSSRKTGSPCRNITDGSSSSSPLPSPRGTREEEFAELGERLAATEAALHRLHAENTALWAHVDAMGARQEANEAKTQRALLTAIDSVTRHKPQPLTFLPSEEEASQHSDSNGTLLLTKR